MSVNRADPLQGLIQKAKRDAENIPYKAYRGGKGFRIWKLTECGWQILGELASQQDVEDFFVGKLTQEDR